ncbi:MAG: coenzyme F420-0:L-glutamate ligase [Candidatus Eremiobacteraeota bacterium]|nr:coenzyme F420-0:L-glutamate ligase [Candidatus Eremiobacteraeota bacterium]
MEIQNKFIGGGNNMWYVISAVIVCTVLFVVLAERAVAAKRGDCRLTLPAERISSRELREDGERAELSFLVPFANTGKSQALLIDCFGRLQPEGDKFKDVDLHVKVINHENPRNDDYWEACLVKPGRECLMKVVLSVKKMPSFKIGELFERFSIDIHYKYYGRNLMAHKRDSLPLGLSHFEQKPPRAAPSPEESPQSPKREAQENVIPIKTHLLRPHEDLAGIISKYAGDKARQGDILTIAESAVAILQGRITYVEDIRPRFLATRLNKLFEMDSSLSSPYSLEMAFREVGVLRILFAAAAGIAGKIVGRSGDFYRVAGKSVATIDDCTGTLPPFDKYVVMGPADLQKVVDGIKEKTGLEGAIVDVNDLRRVDILASTCPQHREYLAKALEFNPAGNANEQTPIVIVKAPSQ